MGRSIKQRCQPRHSPAELAELRAKYVSLRIITPASSPKPKNKIVKIVPTVLYRDSNLTLRVLC
jgi:hypothetical protein